MEGLCMYKIMGNNNIYHNFDPFLISLFYSFIKVYSCLLIELAYYKPAMYGGKF